MWRYVLKRVAFAILILWVVSVVTFAIFVKLPSGDPARRAVGRAATEETLRSAREALGLDDPLYVQYGRFAEGLIPLPGYFLTEDVYFSYSNFVPVKEEIAQRLPVTIALTIGAVVVWICIGVPLGLVGAIRPRSRWDRLASGFSLLGISTPGFWIAYFLLFVFWFKLGLAPPSGIPPGTSVSEAVLEGRFVLPWLALAIPFAAIYTRLIRSSMLKTLNEDFVRTAQAKGASSRRVLFRHAARPTMLPVVTLLGLHIAELLGGAVVIEVVFNLPGIGNYAVRSIFTNDFPAVMGVTIVAAFFIVAANLAIDLLYPRIDPRIRLE